MTVFKNPGYLKALAHDAETGEDTAQFQDRWAYVASDENTYTHPTKTGAAKLAQRDAKAGDV